ncbi:hypothetical protein [Uliginosibacterium sp. TH139]|uniref:hypothetical protein n=1 Tax=Uliginosibacterium sp. TH139 TaxID=2067453 RepID=UPI000C7E7461|nr:hypothetical protein [Uliginosibacterium sp. TH139]PLK50261.1 hypothetical protein C0V76_00030 [Uliginosibacterium sp. TH139]
MRYLFGIGAPLIFQAAVTWLIILASRGNGSFVGLGVMLAGLVGMPLTALSSFLLIRAAQCWSAQRYYLSLALLALLLPLAQLALWLLVVVFEL